MGAASYNDTHVTSSLYEVSQVCYDHAEAKPTLYRAAQPPLGKSGPVGLPSHLAYADAVTCGNDGLWVVQEDAS